MMVDLAGGLASVGASLLAWLLASSPVTGRYNLGISGLAVFRSYMGISGLPVSRSVRTELSRTEVSCISEVLLLSGRGLILLAGRGLILLPGIVFIMSDSSGEPLSSPLCPGW